MLLGELTVPVADFERATGWTIAPEGACRGEVCIPLPAGAATDGRLDVAAVADAIGMPLVRHEHRDDDQHDNAEQNHRFGQIT